MLASPEARSMLLTQVFETHACRILRFAMIDKSYSHDPYHLLIMIDVNRMHGMIEKTVDYAVNIYIWMS